jgi:hypothetical protein
MKAEIASVLTRIIADEMHYLLTIFHFPFRSLLQALLCKQAFVKRWGV